MTQVSRCWCGNSSLEPFSSEYLKCASCETLVARVMPPGDIATVTDDQRDFYGREYWFAHQRELGFTNIAQRARTDLPERCLHWLRVLLKYKLPPGRTLELGSAHGGFVAMMQWAGFEAMGLELSPWVVEYAHHTFDVPVVQGKIERQQLAPASFDAIALMDVLEHLADPAGTMRRCMDVLKPDGVLLIQTPRYVEGRSHDQLIGDADPFLGMMKPAQHLYLFSVRSVGELFRRLGANHVWFEPAIFAHYDMFVAVSRVPLAPHTADAIAHALCASPSGRLMLALIDLDARYLDQMSALDARLAASEVDRAARLKVIEHLGDELGRSGAELAQLRDRIATAIRVMGKSRASAMKALLSHSGWETLSTALAQTSSVPSGRVQAPQQPAADKHDIAAEKRPENDV